MAHGRLPESTPIDQLEVVDEHPLLVYAAAVRRHGARCHASNIGVVATARHEEPDLATLGVEDRRHHRDVRQVGPAVVRCVQHINVTGS